MGGKVPIFPAIGNHDTFPVDQFNRIPRDASHYDDFDWLLSGLAEYWAPFLDSGAIQTLRSGGYYTQLVKPGFRVIALNTQWGDMLNFYLLLQENQKQQQFDWLIDVLTNSEKSGEKVVIIGHIPSGISVPSEYSTYADEYGFFFQKFVLFCSLLILKKFFSTS